MSLFWQPIIKLLLSNEYFISINCEALYGNKLIKECPIVLLRELEHQVVAIFLLCSLFDLVTREKCPSSARQIVEQLNYFFCIYPFL